MRYAFPCTISNYEEEKRGAYVVSFPDVYGANTWGWSWEEALDMAEDCLSVALAMYVRQREDIPIPSPVAENQILIAVPALVAAKLALYTAMRTQGVTEAELAAHLRQSEAAVHKLVDPRCVSPIGQVEKALRAAGHSLVLEDVATYWRYPPISTRKAAKDKFVTINYRGQIVAEVRSPQEDDTASPDNGVQLEDMLHPQLSDVGTQERFDGM